MSTLSASVITILNVVMFVIICHYLIVFVIKFVVIIFVFGFMS